MMLIVNTLICAQLTALPLVFAGKTCFSEPPQWTANNRALRVNNLFTFNLKGVNWWGAQGKKFMPLGLDENHDIAWHLAILKQNRFNAIRYPVSVRMAFEDPETKYQGRPAMDLMEEIIDAAGELGIQVLIDMHCLDYYEATEVWYTNKYSEQQVLRAWDIYLDRFKGKWNVFAIDLMNEPHRSATWGDGNLETDWRRAAQRFIKHINQNHPEFKGLFFVQGKCCGIGSGSWFDQDLAATAVTTADAELDKRVVYSPHHYRPGRKDPTEPAPTAEDLLPALDRIFGKVEPTTGQAVAFGEWGFNPEEPKDVTWANIFTGWLKENCIMDLFYWGLQGGEPGRAIIDPADMTTVDQPKLDFLKAFQPKPSKLYRKGDQFCIVEGQGSNAKTCRK